VGRWATGVAAAGAVQKVQPRQVNETADADRRVRARDQERSREAAANDRLTGDRLGTHRPWDAATWRSSRSGDLSLRELVSPAREELLVGAQIRHLVGAGRR